MGSFLSRIATCLLICLCLSPFFIHEGHPLDSSSKESFRFYEVLNLKRDASDAEIKRAYRRLSLELHPDKVKAKDGDAKQAEQLFQQINRAYQVLSNNRLRRLFDLYGSLYESQDNYYEELKKNRVPEIYKYKKGVHLLHAPNLDALLRGSEYTWIVGFYQAGCGTCERKVPFFSALGAETLSTPNVRLAMVNCQMSHLCHFFGIQQLGQILLFAPNQEGGDSWDHVSYSGPLAVSAVMSEANKVKAPKLEEATSDRQVKERLRSLSGNVRGPFISAAWIVGYYRPSCPPCRALRAELRRMSRSLSEQIGITLVNCDVGRCDAPHFPYIRLFVKQADGIVRGHSLPFGSVDHPGAAAVELTAFIFNTVLGLSPPPSPLADKGNPRARQRDEL